MRVCYPELTGKKQENLIKSNKFDVAKCKAIMLTYDLNTSLLKTFDVGAETRGHPTS
jgi:hypothetical protein